MQPIGDRMSQIHVTDPNTMVFKTKNKASYLVFLKSNYSNEPFFVDKTAPGALVILFFIQLIYYLLVLFSLFEILISF